MTVRTEPALAIGDDDELLAGLDDRLREGRRRLLAELSERGHTEAALREAHRNDRLAVLLLEEVLRESASLTACDVALACGLEPEQVLRIRKLLGLSAVDVGTPAFDPTMCDAINGLRMPHDYVLSEQTVVDLFAALGRHMWQLAADMLIILGNEFGRPGDTEYELAHRYAESARMLAPSAVPLVASAFNAHLRDRMREIFVTPQEAEFGSLEATAVVTVAFIDVVGFTELGERVAAGELKSIAMRLATAAEAVTSLPVRVVKTVGDAVLLMSRDTTALLEGITAFNASARDHDVPPTHIGVARGWAYCGGADVYGATVNLASRLTDLAPGGRVWADRAVVDDAVGFEWVPCGERSVKGRVETVDVYELGG